MLRFREGAPFSMAKKTGQKISGKTDRPSALGNAKPNWKFFRHPSIDWQDWYDNETEDRDQARHDEVFETLEQRPIWRGLGFYEPLADGDGLIEIKIKASKQWRIFGYTGPERHQFTITMICHHKQKIYNPPDAIETGKKRMKDIDNSKIARIACERPGKD
jgi:hypothetical protein